MNLTRSLRTAALAGTGVFCLAAAAPAWSATARECYNDYRAAHKAGTAPGSYSEYKTAHCTDAAAPAAAAAPATEAPKPETAKTEPSATGTSAPADTAATDEGSKSPRKEKKTAAPVAYSGEAVFPSSISSKYSSLSAGKGRWSTCLDQYRANKASGKNGDLVWVGRTKSKSYWSVCNSHLLNK
ncbi:hypothetical protein LOC54_03980 [Acetobacter sp. AN02]|uniref:hypothetical protein n=1 Tax=Acetobacter sp. AN02 TaxID=2894186 RepID=UPI0024340E0A|nr:hypothetical protein [Acetobacter sp. AN02]MDG6094275.1 hypothetical protein [Acetobacter sp. AN02]